MHRVRYTHVVHIVLATFSVHLSSCLRKCDTSYRFRVHASYLTCIRRLIAYGTYVVIHSQLTPENDVKHPAQRESDDTNVYTVYRRHPVTCNQNILQLIKRGLIFKCRAVCSIRFTRLETLICLDIVTMAFRHYKLSNKVMVMDLEINSTRLRRGVRQGYHVIWH